jgi:uncharacterized protein
MKSAVYALLAGALFAVGLAISGMVRPDKVVGFLDLAGEWDASLALVMGGAILVYAPLSRVVTKRAAPLLEPCFSLPTRRDIDWRLLIGAATFGVGWGVGGYCPGPGIVGAATGSRSAILFVASMLLGMFGAQQVNRLLSRGDVLNEDSTSDRIEDDHSPTTQA